MKANGSDLGGLVITKKHVISKPRNLTRTNLFDSMVAHLLNLMWYRTISTGIVRRIETKAFIDLLSIILVSEIIARWEIVVYVSIHKTIENASTEPSLSFSI